MALVTARAFGMAQVWRDSHVAAVRATQFRIEIPSSRMRHFERTVFQTEPGISRATYPTYERRCIHAYGGGIFTQILGLMRKRNSGDDMFFAA